MVTANCLCLIQKKRLANCCHNIVLSTLVLDFKILISREAGANVILLVESLLCTSTPETVSFTAVVLLQCCDV